MPEVAPKISMFIFYSLSKILHPFLCYNVEWSHFVTQTALNNTKDAPFFMERGIFVASVRGISYFCTRIFMFQDLERMFHALERIFQTLERTFHDLEYKILRVLK